MLPGPSLTSAYYTHTLNISLFVVFYTLIAQKVAGLLIQEEFDFPVLY